MKLFRHRVYIKASCLSAEGMSSEELEAELLAADRALEPLNAVSLGSIPEEELLRDVDELRRAMQGPLSALMAASSAPGKAPFLAAKALSICSQCLGAMRERFLEMGRRFASKQLLASHEDILFLNLDEVRQIVSGGCAGNTCNNYRLRVMMRRREIMAVEGEPPATILL